jgi:NO-binding membrane sensor protein with MHYT domain
MAEVHHFEFGVVSPLLAAVSAIAGCVLGIILSTKAQKVTGGARVRLLIYASIAFGATAVWQSNVVALLGLGVGDSAVRLDVEALAIGLGFAVLTIGTGLFVVGAGRMGPARIGTVRLTVAGVFVAVGIGGTQWLVLNSVNVLGVVTYFRPLLVVSLVLAVVAAGALLLFVVSARGLRSTIAAGAGAGVAICAVHYIGEYGIRVDLGSSPVHGGGMLGVAPMFVALPTMVFGAVMFVMMCYFTLGSATRNDLHVIFSSRDPDPIENWMIDEVTARIARPVTPEPARAVAVAKIPPRYGRPGPGSRPAPSFIPVWRSLPAPGQGSARDRHLRDVRTNQNRGATNRGQATVLDESPLDESLLDESLASVATPIVAPVLPASALPVRPRPAAAALPEPQSTIDPEPLPRRRNDRWDT